MSLFRSIKKISSVLVAVMIFSLSALPVFAATTIEVKHVTDISVSEEVAQQILGKRARYYHSQMDMDILASGQEYKELPPAYVIFVCDFDPFGMGK